MKTRGGEFKLAPPPPKVKKGARVSKRLKKRTAENMTLTAKERVST